MRHDDFIRHYLVEVYGNRRLDLVGEFIADPQIRHDAGETLTLGLDASTARIAGFFDTYSTLDFWPVVLVADDDMVTCAWNADLTSRAGETVQFSAIELFRIGDGKIAEVWNTTATRGHWLP